jgi:hypothetical protein
VCIANDDDVFYLFLQKQKLKYLEASYAINLSPSTRHTLASHFCEAVRTEERGVVSLYVALNTSMTCPSLSFSIPPCLPSSLPPSLPPSPSLSWKHTSVTLDDDHILIFGGLADKNKRFDDVWIFEVSTGVWRNVKHAGTPPCPRAHHSATMVGNKMYVWGGYGGHGQRRSFYNDLHALETAPYVPHKEKDDRTAPDAEEYDEGDLVWSKIVAGGTAPEPRSNHTCSLIAVPASSANKMLCVLGTDSQKYSLQTFYIVNLIGH